MIVAVAVVIAAGAVLLSNQGVNDPGAPGSTMIANVSSLLRGIPEAGTVLGSPRAPVTMTYFGDLECPTCQAFTLDGGFPELVSRNVRAGQVKVTYRSLCSATCAGPGETTFYRQQVAAYAAGEQHRFWYYAELFYRQQGVEGTAYATPAFLVALAHETPGLDMTAWRRATGEVSLVAQVEGDDETAQALRIASTPTLIMSGPRGVTELREGVPTYAELERAITRVS